MVTVKFRPEFASLLPQLSTEDIRLEFDVEPERAHPESMTLLDETTVQLVYCVPVEMVETLEIRVLVSDIVVASSTAKQVLCYPERGP